MALGWQGNLSDMIINKKVLAGLVVLALCATESCTDNEKEKYTPAKYNISGKVEKGPFINGSTIEIQPMDAEMHVLGGTFSATISDNSGSFDLGSRELLTPFAVLTSNGYFFNEVDGDLSKGTLTLRAVVDLTDKSTVNVNILTHLKYQRILNLIAGGESFDKANLQAQKEILAAFGLQRFSDTDVSQYSIAAGTGEAGALIAISSLLLVERTEAELTEYLAKLSEEFGQSGTFSEESERLLKTDQNKLSNRLPDIADHIVTRYNSLGMTVSVKDLSYYFDWNDDGIAGNEIPGSDNPVTLDQSELNVPVEGGEYAIRISSSVPVTLASNSSGDIVETEILGLYQSCQASHTTTIENETLKVNILPATKRIIIPTTINIYDYRGNVVAVLTIHQEGNPVGDLFTRDGTAAILELASRLSEAIGLSNTMDAKYTKLLGNSDFIAPVSPGDQNLANCWKDYYGAINLQLNIAKVDQEAGNLLQASINTLNALCYNNLVSFWGDVPYRTKDELNYSYPRATVDTIYEMLEVNLEAAIDELEDKKNVFATNAEEFIFFSKDVPRIILARIYMDQSQYTKAEALLEKVVSKGYYQLENSINYSSSSKELIFGLKIQDGSRSASTVTPVLTYTDVILLLAECELNLGNQNAARNYLDQVANKKKITVFADVETGIKEVRKEALSGCGGYFSFLKRNEMAISELGLKENQLLLPIPGNELEFNSAMTQNPGY